MDKNFIHNHLLNSLGNPKPGVNKKFNTTTKELYNIYHGTSTPKCVCGKNVLFNSFKKGYRVTCGEPKCRMAIEKKSIKITKENINLVLTKSKGISSRKVKMYNISIKEVYDLLYQPKYCVICLKEHSFISFKKGYKNKCDNKCKIKCSIAKEKPKVKSKVDYNKRTLKTQLNNMEKYGVKNFAMLEESIIKAKKTKLERYGDENYNNPQKRAANNLVKYGATTYFGSEEGRAAIVEIKNKKNGTGDGYINWKPFNKRIIIERYLRDEKIDIESIKVDYKRSTSFVYKKMKDLTIPFKSKFSKEKEINIEFNNIFTINDRKLIKPLELDLYSKEHNFAIEYNGLMWHSFGHSKHSMFNKPIEHRNKHLRKTELAEEKGIQLFHIFENEWLDKNKKSIWVSMIEDKLNKNRKIGARKCSIKEVPTKEARRFIDDNHMQGYCNSSIKIGMYYEDSLMSIMTFGKPRFNKDIDYELIRFCTKKGYTIQGGGSRMLKYFEKTYKPKSLLSYANRRWSTGNFYIKSGFTFKYNTTPNYFYFHPKENILWSRNKFQKHKLKGLLETFNPDVTETINMFNNGYRKIYDSGNKVFLKEY